MKHITFSLLIVFSIGWSHAQEDSTKSLITETMLHPGDAFTAYVFKKGEWAYNQAITPYPSWAWWGITNRITAELDLEAWIGGVPSFNFRVAILSNERFKPAIAFETMYQYLKDERDQFHNLDYLAVERQGSNWYNHINLSWQLPKNFHLHLSGGATFGEHISISNGDSIDYIGNSFQNKIHPDYSLGIDWKFSRWMTLHSTASYGSTFLYADNIARKQQFSLASRVAPFINSKYGFLNCFRFELALIHAEFKDAGQSLTGPIGFLYWQWDWSKENRQKRKELKHSGT